jgi:hypothetical protein
MKANDKPTTIYCHCEPGVFSVDHFLKDGKGKLHVPYVHNKDVEYPHYVTGVPYDKASASGKSPIPTPSPLASGIEENEAEEGNPFVRMLSEDFYSPPPLATILGLHKLIESITNALSTKIFKGPEK